MPATSGHSLLDFKALTFDCYGTLIDWEAGIWDAFQPLIACSGRRDLGRRDFLEAFGHFECRQEAATPGMAYGEVLGCVHRAVAREFGMQTTTAMDTAFGESLPHWPAFPDTAGALRDLKTRYRLVILSNVSRAGFAASNRKLGVEFDAVYTAEDIGSYKPDPANFKYLLAQLDQQFGLQKHQILHTAQSLFHDHVPARVQGMATVWIDRQRLSETGNWGATAAPEQHPEPDFVFHSMAEMAAAVAAAEAD
jgi:2-haloalkanoic acid dehalogenase type II